MTGSDGTLPDGNSGHDGRHDGRHNSTVEARLRRALTTEAAMVQPAGDGLQKIRDGVDGRGARAWWKHPAFALVAAAVLGLAVSGVYVGVNGGGDDETTTTGATSDTSATQTEPTPTEAPSSPASPTPSVTAGGHTAYVYYVHDDGQSPRLYREQHAVAVKDVPTAILALEEMFTQSPADPDYATPWPQQPLVRGYEASDGVATVDLSEFLSVSEELETAAVQEIVYTVTANDPSVKKVRLRVKGEAPKGHSDWSEPIARAPMLDVQGLIWLLSPTQGETVSSPVKIEGFGTAFEATISWEVRKDGKVVKDGVTSGGANGEFDDFTDTVDLPAGDYEISAFESSAEDGRPIHIDTKNFTVK
jgi:Immunoglobulin-like domain of bacterial spore germination/Sporulation and spore germination